jgi:ATP synthase F1 gamma subunit
VKRPNSIKRDFEQLRTIEDLTSVFEAIASIHIAQVRDRALSSTKFFNELWAIYRQLRADADAAATLSIQRNDRTALVAITSDGGLIGDIDERIIQAMLNHPNKGAVDLFLIGTHGAALLAQRNIRPLKVFGAPDLEKGENVRSLAKLLGGYGQAAVYYQTYVSLMHQDVARIDLFSVVQSLGAESAPGDDVIASTTYILEPSAGEITGFMESVMVEIALSQVVLESRLAQYASRFNAMYAAKSKAKELKDDLGLELHQTQRATSDARTKEIFSGMKATRLRNGASAG